ATRVRVEDTAELIAVLARALAEAAVSDAAAVERGSSAGRGVGWRPKTLLARVRRLVGGGASGSAGTAAGPAADCGGEARWLADHPRRAV
ncbi:MAG: hypothetical protein JWL70_1073, partial [Acidimicrobiia bacterium]|nr:hypothetical protein [Acidimicrobiia bacterium]